MMRLVLVLLLPATSHFAVAFLPSSGAELRLFVVAGSGLALVVIAETFDSNLRLLASWNLGRGSNHLGNHKAPFVFGSGALI